ncbi:hypothetical protein IQ273_31680 [Nodosilinea sp. LEGE 07298]|uniref:hypothetical protein n=1 Tax=Nodosilinea sp. LEGE 07298 TaxID=2777970 RepID=UPI0018816665|nr:hypothetical protein [Nodosilinea sp. LEGE 07298]MBE9113933.1 hypothetical protein [Nodosilinea sp. LEGE 07298]
MLGALMGGILAGQLAIAPLPPDLSPSDLELLSQAPPMLGRDAIPYPPLLRHEASPAGTYHLVLTLGQEATGTRRTTASLFEMRGDRCQQVWSQTLPHSYGPRLALVTDAGTVVLLDEWINVASPYAMTVLGPNGAIAAQHSFDDIVEVTGQTRAEVVEQAAQGFWLTGEPEIADDGSQVLIPAADGQITLDLATGELRF